MLKFEFEVNGETYKGDYTIIPKGQYPEAPDCKVYDIKYTNVPGTNPLFRIKIYQSDKGTIIGLHPTKARLDETMIKFKDAFIKSEKERERKPFKRKLRI